MTKDELVTALEIAKSPISLENVDDSLLFGYGLRDFNPVHVTIEAVAKTIRWDCIMLNGEVDAEALDNLCKNLRRKITVI
jgi:hypothetical protein